MQVDGRDPGREAYGVRMMGADGEMRAWVPEALMAPHRITHEAAYAWIAAHQAGLERAILALAAGKETQKYRGLCLQRRD